MKIAVSDKGILVSEYTNEQLIDIEKLFTFNDVSEAYAKGKFDKTKIIVCKMYRLINEGIIIRAGFLQDIVTYCIKRNWKFAFEDLRTHFPYQKNEYSYDELRAQYNPDFEYVEHQIDSLKKLLKTNRGIVKAPTSSGKTNIMAAFIKMVKQPVLILVNKTTLASQIMEKMEENEAGDFGIWSGEKKVDGKDGVVALIGSVKSYPNLGRFKIIIADEVHGASAATYQEFLSKVQFSVYIGFSATPNKGDAYRYALIRQFFGSTVCEIRSEKLIENNVMVKPRIFMIENYVQKWMTWPSTFENEIIRNNDRNNKIVEIVTTLNKPSLILINDVKNGQGESLRQKFDKEGKRVEFISGDMKNSDRMNIIHGFDKGEYDVIIGTTVLDEGVSINSIRVFVNGSGGKSKVKALQRLGRSLRISEGKTEAWVFDFQDIGNDFTERHSSLRRKHYIDEGYTDITEISMEEIDKIS